MTLTHVGLRTAASAVALGLLSLPASAQGVSNPSSGAGPFERIATFPIFENTSASETTVAEIVAASANGTRLAYTDSELNAIGFVDITDPENPKGQGIVGVGGEPTSVAIAGRFALACVNTSADFVNTSGLLQVINVRTQQIVRTLPLGGQPDAIAISPDGNYAAICIENERDEELGDGEPPQLPAGFLVIVDLNGDPSNWSTRDVTLTGVADLFPEDPEPEFVDISNFNIAAVTLQENNHVVFVSLVGGNVIGDFNLGAVDLDGIDTNENDLIEQNSSLEAVPREPDAITWLSAFTFATADEGDLFGGSRGFTIFDIAGNVRSTSGNTMDQFAARIGHYPEGRSENKGVEPESVEFGRFGNQRFLFVGSERANLIYVYSLPGFLGFDTPVFLQVLPTGVAPEGLLAIPNRDLLVVSCEDDAQDDAIRASIMIYRRTGNATYPTIESEDRPDGSPIPWAALSGLASDSNDVNTAYTVHDSFYQDSRYFTLDLSQTPATITAETRLFDTDGVLLAALNQLAADLPETATADFDISALVDADGGVNLDLEGISQASNGNFWVCHEGRGNLNAGVSDPEDRPFESPNMILEINPAGDILDVAFPPQSVTENQFRFGFEGVAVEDGAVWVSWQRAWQNAGDPADMARIGRFDLGTRTWSFSYYPLDDVASPNGGWVGQADLVRLGDGTLVVLERDNQGGPDAAVKRVYSVANPSGAFVGGIPVVGKSLVRDLLATGTFEPFAGFAPEKIEGFAVLSNGDALLVNDNDGVDDNSGETLLIRLEGLFD
ncbi:MAG: esterase-like activity of phytase family protein [Planctomycetota bacterium]